MALYYDHLHTMKFEINQLSLRSCVYQSFLLNTHGRMHGRTQNNPLQGKLRKIEIIHKNIHNFNFKQEKC